MEQEIVFFLLQTAAPHHQLRSAFMRNSIHGWVYLETTMNEDLIHHLRLSPGVVRRNAGIIREQVDFEDWTKVLSQHDSDTHSNLAVGDWVRVRKGTYKGDAGYVTAVENWGGVGLLLVPRLPGPRHPGSSLSKRKCSTTPPEPTLFDPLAIKRIYGIDPVWQEPYVYRFNGYTFEHGLILKAFDLCSVSSTSVQIPTQQLFLFRSADHPALTTSTFPQPLEWNFAEGEVVWLHCPRKRGIIKDVGDTFADVDFQMEEGVVRTPLSNLLKEFHTGDFVKIMGGPSRGQSGWVEGGWNNVVRVVVVNSSGDATEVRDVKAGPFFNGRHLNSCQLLEC
jgi:transcription antitermination factor NusG